MHDQLNDAGLLYDDSCRRPAACLDEPVPRGSSVWAQVGRAVEARAVDGLCADLLSG